MARAKQTNRADARRRYRQAVAQASDEQDAGETSEVAPAASGQRSTGRSSTATTPQGRPGIGFAFRNSYHQPHYREDLRALPQLLRGRWFLISAAVTVLGWVAYYVAGNDPFVSLVFSVVSFPPGGPVLPLFLVGFTAPRASYLLGLALGVVNIVAAVVAVAAAPGLATTGNLTNVLTQGIVYGLPTAVLFSAGAAWYKRFLSLSSPRMQAGRGGSRSRSSGKSGSKATARR